MPLVDLKTDLTSLKFGKDRPGGGSSREPFVKGKSLDKRIAEDGIETLASTGGTDMFIRGGGKVASSTAKDLERLGKYFTTTEGGLFIAQQNLLSRVGVKLQAGDKIENLTPKERLQNIQELGSLALSNGIGENGLGGVAVNTRNRVNPLNNGTYLPLSTLLAAGGTALGIHPNKQGIDPTGLTALSLITYSDLVKTNQGNSLNRLYSLYKNKITSRKDQTPGVLFDYPGGPNSDLGIGKTTVFRTTNTLLNNSGESISVNQNGISYSTYSQLGLELYSSDHRLGKNSSINNGGLKDFRELLANPSKSNGPTKIEGNAYSKQNIEQRVNLGNPGARGQDRSDFTRGNPNNDGGLDKINSLYLYKSETVTSNDRKNDLVKFRIAVIDNDNPSEKTFIHFRAFINSFSDNMNASWNSFKYTGRGEDFYTYQGFNNSISMGFTVAVQSIQELSIVYQKLNYLKSSLAPNYSDEGYMRGNIHQLTFGGYFYEVPGIIESLTYTIPDGTPYEIGIPSNFRNAETAPDGSSVKTNPAVKELPLVINVEMSFKPIYNFLPKTVENVDGVIESRFISLANTSKRSLYDNKIGPEFKV